MFRQLLFWDREEGIGYVVLTLVQLKVGDGLPLVRRNEPLVVFPSAGEVDDEFCFVVVEGLEDGAEAVHGEGGGGEEVRCYDYLLRVD